MNSMPSHQNFCHISKNSIVDRIISVEEVDWDGVV